MLKYKDSFISQVRFPGRHVIRKMTIKSVAPPRGCFQELHVVIPPLHHLSTTGKRLIVGFVLKYNKIEQMSCSSDEPLLL